MRYQIILDVQGHAVAHHLGEAFPMLHRAMTTPAVLRARRAPSLHWYCFSGELDSDTFVKLITYCSTERVVIGSLRVGSIAP